MKSNRTALALLGCIGITAAAADPKVSSSDLDRAHLYLQETRNLVVGATRGLSPSQWEFKPAPDRWSIAQIVEHMVLAQDFVLGPVREQLAKAPAPRAAAGRQADEVVIDKMPDRTAKFQAPDFLQPTGRWTPSVSMDHLLKNYAELVKYLETTPDLRQHAVDAPALKAISEGGYDTMDGYQSILLVAAHTERHTKQILEVCADANFPAK
ncbi:MAG TPA: DinB family protein [Bryobacteraceae bacterium]|nr:DinB family protein [Bryobacteraceae bacterium]